MTNNLELSKQDIKDALWIKGNLSFLLDPVQKELYNLFHKTNHKVQTWLLARRSGKSHTLCVLAIEQCLKKPNSIVKIVSPTKLQVNNNIRPLIKKILESCPEELKPHFKTNDYIYFFPNGSEIQLSGTDNGHAEKLRGGDSDICIIDEAGSCKELDYLVKSVLLPTTLITKGKVLLSSTPPKEPDHDFLKYIEEADMRGSLIRKTIDDNPRISLEDKEELIRELGGPFTEDARRELYCMVVRDSTTCVIPEFTEELQKEIIKDWPRPPFYDCYEAMDLGGKDLTVVLFGYYDFRADKAIIEDELVLDFSKPSNGIDKLVEEISKKEKLLWFNVLTNEQKKPYTRVSDINYIVTNEIARTSNNKIVFETAKKDDLSASINNLRSMLGTRKVIINPRCETLIRHIKNAKWYSPNNMSKFSRSPDNGHYDALSALIYFVRHIIFSKNPYPHHYDMNLKDLFVANPGNFKSNDPNDVYKRIFNINKLKKKF